MKKVLLTLALVIGLAGLSEAGRFGRGVDETHWFTIVDSQTVNATAISTSTVIDVGEMEDFSVMVEVHSGSSVDVKLTYEVVNDNADLAGSIAGDAIYVQPVNNGEIVSSVTADYAIEFQPIPTKWLRIKVTGNAGNGADTVVSVYLCGYSER